MRTTDNYGKKKINIIFVWPYLTMGIIMIVVISLVMFINQNVQKNNWIWVSPSKSVRLRYSRSLVWVSRASWEILFKRCEFMRGLTRGQGQRIKKVRAASSCLQIVLNTFFFSLRGLVLASCTRFELQQNSKGRVRDYRTLTCNIGKS